jgi:hypothetical protein
VGIAHREFTCVHRETRVLGLGFEPAAGLLARRRLTRTLYDERRARLRAMGVRSARGLGSPEHSPAACLNTPTDSHSPGEKMGVRPPICPNLLQVCALGSADSAAGMSWGIAWVGLEGGSAPAPIPATSRMTKATQYSLLLTVCDRGWPAIALCGCSESSLRSSCSRPLCSEASRARLPPPACVRFPASPPPCPSLSSSR